MPQAGTRGHTTGVDRAAPRVLPPLLHTYAGRFLARSALLQPLWSTDAPPAAAHYPLAQAVLAKGETVLAEPVFVGSDLLEADPPAPFR